MIDALNILGDSNVTIVRDANGYAVGEMAGTLTRGQAYSLALTHKLAFEAGQRAATSQQPSF